jgi:phosphoenolpyruvate-protein kinase (PTS system EI component)
VADAEAAGADGIGVVRAESLFGGDPVLPGEDEQAALYARICSALPGRPVVLRTLDAGGDTAPAPPGLRGIRLTLRQPELMVPQLRAALRTAAAGHPLRLLLPMVTVADEIHRTRELLRQARADLAAEGLHPPGHLPLGITVDTPAAALKAGTLLGAADFVAIGTDDLTRYTLAAERGDADVAHLLREWDPAVLRLIASVAAAAGESGESGVPVAVLGAAARDPRMLPLLLGLGVRELAVPSADIAAVKEQVRRLDTGRLAPAAARALRAGSAEEVLRLVDRMDPGLAPQNGET